MMETLEPLVLELAGELDLASAPDLRARLLTALETVRWKPERGVDVDLAGVIFMDAAALGMIASAAARCERAGARLRVVNANPIQRKMFHLFGLDHLIDGDAETPMVPRQSRSD